MDEFEEWWRTTDMSVSTKETARQAWHESRSQLAKRTAFEEAKTKLNRLEEPLKEVCQGLYKFGLDRIEVRLDDEGTMSIVPVWVA